MIRSTSEVGTSKREKRGKKDKKKREEKKKWGPFGYFLIVSSVLILVMWGVIIFGGQKAPPRTIHFAKKGRVLLFMVDGAIKRYALYERDRYPEHLTDLIPKYISPRDREAFHLKKLSYERDSEIGYRLSLASPKLGEMNVVLTPEGIQYTPPSQGGA